MIEDDWKGEHLIRGHRYDGIGRGTTPKSDRHADTDAERGIKPASPRFVPQKKPKPKQEEPKSMALDPHDIQRGAQAVADVKSIDSIIAWLAKDLDARSAEWGGKVRDIFGRNRMDKFNDGYLGEVVFCAIINALLRQRIEIVDEHKEIVELPAAPCPQQEPNSDD